MAVQATRHLIRSDLVIRLSLKVVQGPYTQPHNEGSLPLNIVTTSTVITIQTAELQSRTQQLNNKQRKEEMCKG